MGKVLVFFGGKSVEHDISVITGVMTANAINKGEYQAIPVFIDKDGKWFTGKNLLNIDNYKGLNYKKLKQVYLLPNSQNLYIKNKFITKTEKIDCAINCLHGGSGEDGSLAGLMKFTLIPFASPNTTVSSICMDKAITKIVLKGFNVKCLPYFLCESVKEGLIRAEKFKFPLIVKPYRLGSSIGITKANNKEQLEKGIDLALKYGKMAIIETCLTNFTEINCACYKNSKGEIIVSECEKPLFSGDIMTFNDKYLGECDREFPANISVKLSNKIKRTTAHIYNKLNANGIIRVDFMISNGTIYLNEINTVPGSLAYYLFCNTFKQFGEILKDIIGFTMKSYRKENSFISSYSSSALNLNGEKSCKIKK